MYQTLLLKNLEGLKIPNGRTVYSVMDEIGLSHRPKRKSNGITRTDWEARKLDDLLRRDFKSNKPLEKCVTDITEIKRYLCTIIQNKMGINKLKVVLTEEAQAFLDAQPFKAQQKIYYNIFKVEEGVMKVDIFKKLENTEIWEFRTLYNGICYRLFSFWDTEEETLVIATHGIVKKTQKTPLKEIAKAEEIRKEYFNNKNK